MESTDRLIRKELMYDNVCTSVERLRSDLNRYVWWYDHQRLHSTLDYMSPVEFTQQGKTLQEQSNTPLPIHALVAPSNLHMMKNLGNTLLCRPLCRRLYSGRQR
ncbi:IS3 family transposase [Bifidobacterium catenulatum]|uniref:IS3 family transposase n=1 Tax=Bifidobacterium TaxID=1678 RepID=UPI0021C60A26|nr:IS3 family transposase [Bifidobacterium catenulatum]